MAKIDEFLGEILQKKGSDLHFLAGDPPPSASSATCYAPARKSSRPDFVKDCLYEIMPKQAVRRFDIEGRHRFPATTRTGHGAP